MWPPSEGADEMDEIVTDAESGFGWASSYDPEVEACWEAGCARCRFTAAKPGCVVLCWVGVLCSGRLRKVSLHCSWEPNQAVLCWVAVAGFTTTVVVVCSQPLYPAGYPRSAIVAAL